MYALTNTMTRTDTCAGTIISMHCRRGTAELANSRLQKLVRKNNGTNSYLPTVVCFLPSRRWRRGAYVNRCDILPAYSAQ